MNLADIRSALHSYANPTKARDLQRFFKTGPGEYAEGDRFIGIMVPTLHALSRKFHSAPDRVTNALLQSAIHEERLLALLILKRQFIQGDTSTRTRIAQHYLSRTAFINNWDLVDLSAPYIIGPFLEKGSRAPLHKLAQSTLLWERRIAIVATFHFIRMKDFTDALAIADPLRADPEDLIHKATGWMLREIGKRDQSVLESFLRPRCRRMPRTMLRYAIERFPEPLRQTYLKGTVRTS
jgi:3-methyladenine DNA glycosylase AlkD